MEQEARETPAVAARLLGHRDDLARLGERLRALAPRYALALGRGSSDAAALLAKYLFELRLGVPTVSAAPSVLSIYGRRLALERALLLVISQSGRSPDLVEFCRAAAGPEVLRVALLNEPSAPLAGAVDTCLPLEAGQEKSVAATKSCLAAMLLAFALAAYWRADRDAIVAFERAPDALGKALAQDWSAGEDFFAADGSVYVIGRGPGLAIAAEAALKLKETMGLHAEAVSAAEIRHGPLALAGPRLRVVIFAARDAAFESLRQLGDELAQLGCPLLFISPQPALSPLHVAPDAEPVLEHLAMLLRFYVLASAGALRRGRSPDAPPLLRKITETR